MRKREKMIAAEQFNFFAELVRDSSGIALKPGKEYLIESRLNELSRVIGLRSIDDLYRKAKFSMTPKLKDQIIEAMTTNETYFFRDLHPFQALEKEIIPKLGTSGKKIRFWSAACSTGQEPYSIAIILAEKFPHLAAGKAEILATDISQQAIQKGMSGRFTQVEVNRGLPVTLLVKYFKQQGAFWIINEKLRRLVRFKKMNLLNPFVGMGTFDVIFCRYVLIYFDQGTKKQILEKLVSVLNPGGYLFLGATESAIGLPSSMKRKSFGRTTCWQKDSGKLTRSIKDEHGRRNSKGLSGRGQRESGAVRPGLRRVGAGS